MLNCKVIVVLLVSDEEGAVAGPNSSDQLPKGAKAAAINGDEEGEGESVFSKLEKTRTILETSLGLSSLLEAYTLIQVATCGVYNTRYTEWVLSIKFRPSMKMHLEVMRSLAMRSCSPRISWLPLLGMKTSTTVLLSST